MGRLRVGVRGRKTNEVVHGQAELMENAYEMCNLLCATATMKAAPSGDSPFSCAQSTPLGMSHLAA